jgi:hypothetical protein
LEFGTQQEILSPYAGPPLPAGTDELHSSAGTNQTSGCEPITQEHTAGLDKLSESEPTAQAQNESRLAAGVDKTFETEFTSQARDNPPATQQDSNLSQDKAAEGCRETETEIPSRQPDNSGPRDSNSQEQEQSSSKEQNLQIPETTEEETAAEFQDQSAHSHTPTVGGDSQQEERSSEPKLAFLTQPEFEINFVSEPSESLSSRVNESSNLNTNIQSGLKSQALSAEEHDNLNSRVSQAAQIVSGAFEVPGQQSLGSDILSARVPDNTNYNSAYNTSGFDLTSCDLSTKSAIEESSKRKRPSAAEHIARVLQAIDRKEDPIDCIMFDADPQEGSSSGRVSAVTELQKLWDADPPTRTAEDLPKEEPSFTEPTSSTDVQLAADSKAMNSFVDDDWVNQSQPHVPGLPDVSPPSLMPPPLPSATDSLQRLVDDALGITTGPVSQPLLNPESQPLQQATVSPADISKPNEFENTTLALLPSLHAQDPISAETVRSPVGAISMAQLPLATEGFSPSTDQEADSKTYLVTLPFQASIRALYDETLFKDRRAVTKFGEAFTNEIYVEPEASLVKSVDKLLNQLQNLCDYPQDALGTALDEMRPSQRVKYSLDASPKLNFVFELLQGLESGANILIMARNPHILRILGEVAEVLGVDFACVSTGHSPENGYLASAVRATLALPVEKVDLSDFDIVIAYDNSFINAHAAQQSPDGQLGKKSPLVLNLITAYSIEHIDYFVTKNQGELERKNALLFGIVKARDLLNDPPQMVEPHEAAKTFYDFVNEITDSIRWEPEDLPDQILDAYIATQTQLSVEMSPSADNGRKRKLVSTSTRSSLPA